MPKRIFIPLFLLLTLFAIFFKDGRKPMPVFRSYAHSCSFNAFHNKSKKSVKPYAEERKRKHKVRFRVSEVRFDLEPIHYVFHFRQEFTTRSLFKEISFVLSGFKSVHNLRGPPAMC